MTTISHLALCPVLDIITITVISLQTRAVIFVYRDSRRVGIYMNENEQAKPLLFGLGKLYVTRGIHALMDEHNLDVAPFIARHLTGDWGEVCADDAAENQLSLEKGFRILSAYHFAPDDDPNNPIKLWIITEADRSVTTVLLPEEY